MGRRRIHRDDAARAAAWRARTAGLAVKCEILDRPTLHLLQYVARKLAESSVDPALTGAAAARFLLDGLEQGAGRNCSDAARNFVRHETDESALGKPGEEIIGANSG